MFVKRLFIGVKGSSILMSSGKYYSEVGWHVYVTWINSTICKEGKEREKSITFVHCPQDEFMTLGEQKMEGTNLVFSQLSPLSTTWVRAPCWDKYNLHFQIFSKYLLCNLIPKCLPWKPAVTSCLTKEMDLYSKAAGKIVLDLMSIVLEGHYQGHYSFYFIFVLSTHFKTNSQVRCYCAVNALLLVTTII